MRKILLAVFALSVMSISNPAYSAGGGTLPPKELPWSFDGFFGTVDKQSAQRGLQVYKEVCAACHSLKRVAFRDLEKIGFSADEVKAIAAGYSVKDGPNDAGDMFQRPGRPSDRFVPPFANDKAAKAANGGALPPDLSLIVKARPNGANYIYSLLTGYEDPPAEVHINEGLYYNPYFIAGNQVAMAPPLSDGGVSYIDGTEATKDQMAKDVVNFLQWAAEPEMEQRKSMGAKVMLFLFLIAGLFIAANIRTWEKVKKG